ncbi:HAMP domain-containing sensor histidine kinase [Streptomyces sp. NBC_01373]|uniref:sensor histidine kinase n=1 Tax=Streptomyces sp. NBC_01373 TaxID=2903843 RepID=UPI002255F2AC|nr:HAMP domain-containing sensor histidine kinase [Streptomyces sp. NBC_01373]MCX4704558.1 HAMP domain-containing histidine kinase [Streptomyces sp. NBC_01373]
MTTEPLLSVLAEWPGRWRHPGLADALSGGGTGTLDEAAAHVLAGLADPLTTTESIERLLEQGHFELVDEFLAECAADGPALQDTDPVDAARIRDALAAARLAARAEAERDLALLGERAIRAGLGSASLPGFLDEVNLRTSRAAALLDREREKRIVPAERSLRTRLERRLAELPDDRVDRKAVEDCLSAGEFPAALLLLESSHTEQENGGPAAVPRPPLWDPALGSRLEEILPHYSEEAAARTDHRLRRFTDVGETGGEAARALNDLVTRPEPTTAGAFARALGHLLGEDVRFPVTARDGGFCTAFVGLNDARLPRTTLHRDTGAVLWIADEDTPPPDDLLRPLVWFRTTGPQREPTGRPDGVAVLTATDLLRLLARPAPGTPAGPATRRVNLLRLLVPQLGVEGISDPDKGITLGRGVPPREGLAWLLDLLAVSAEAVVMDTLHYETGAHPVILPRLLGDLLSRLPSPRTLTLTALAAVRNRRTRDDLRAVLTAPLRLNEGAVLGMAYALHQHVPFRAADLAADMTFFDVPAEFAAETVRLLDVEAALAQLASHGLLSADGDTWATLPSGLGRLLAEDAEELVGSSLRALLERVEQADAHARIALTDQAMTVIGHRNDNRVASILDDLSRLEGSLPPEARDVLDRLRDRASQFRGEHYQDAVAGFLRPAEPGDLVQTVQEVTTAVQHEYGVQIDVWPSAPELLRVHAVKAYVKIAVENLLMNAAQALGTVEDHAEGRIVVRLQSADRGPDGGEPAPWCTVDVEDSGPGLTEDERAALRVGRTFSRNGSGGSGLALARELVRECRGTIEILEGSPLGGAHLRVWLPRV